MKDFLKHAEGSLRSAKILFEAEEYNSAVNRAYYAMHTAALHLFFVNDMPLPKTHHGTHTLLNKEFVQAGKLPSERAADLSIVENARLVSDYNGGESSEKDAKKCIDKADKFLKAIKEFLAKS